MPQAKYITKRYGVIDKLGQGGMGAVWRVYDRLAKTEVALKQVLLPATDLDFVSKAGTDDTDKLRLSLAHEFSILAALRHPNILSVLDFGFDEDGHPFYTMDLLEGGTDVKAYASDLSRGRRIVLLGQMLQAMHYLHRRGVLHRDLKPDNVFVSRDEQIKVMDFGLAKLDLQGSSSKNTDTITGTISYMAPEQFQGGKASVASDLFAVGVMVYEIMAGHHPYKADNLGQWIMKIMTHTPDFSPIPNNFVPWLQRILEKDPANRFPTAYDAMIEFYDAVNVERPSEDQTIRESFLQASKFIGREAEFKQLTDALEKLKTENAFFLIGGESGVGKSRLLDELRIRALVSGIEVMRGQGAEGGGLPFQLWRNIVRRLLLTQEVSDLQAGILLDIVPDIADVLGRGVERASELMGIAYQTRLVLTIVDLLRDLQQPIVLLLEDLQWTSQSLAVLEQMLKVPEQLTKLMIVANYRDDEAPDLPEKLAGMAHIKLERLDANAVSELSRAMLGDAGANEEVAKLLYSQSEGNLFFLVETVRALAEASGDLQRIGQGELPEGVFTGGMQAIMRRRLSKVDAQYTEIQTLVAIIGREVDIKLLRHAYDEVTIEAWLNNAADYNVVSIQDNVWRFAHDKLREALIVDIADDELPQIHRTAAETIEAVYPDDANYNEVLLDHWQQVGDLDKIYHYTLLVAYDMAHIKGQYTIAETQLHEVLDRLAVDDVRCIALWNQLAESTSLQGKYELCQYYANQARQTATKLNNHKGLAKSLETLGHLAFYQGENGRANDVLKQSLALFQKLDDQRGISEILNALGVVAESQGDYTRAIKLHQQNLTIKQQLVDQHGIAVAFINQGMVNLKQGKYDHANELLEQSLALFQQTGDQRAISINFNHLGTVAYKQEDYIHATDRYQQALTISREMSNQYIEALSLNNLGFVSQYTAPEKAQSYFMSVLAIAHPMKILPFMLQALVGLAWVILQAKYSARAAQLAGLVQAHPANNNSVQEKLDAFIPELESALSPNELQAALERGKKLDLDTVVQQLLDEFAPLDDGAIEDKS